MGKGEVQEVRILNRILRETRLGIEYEADPRHAEMIIGCAKGSSKGRRVPAARERSTKDGSEAEMTEAEGKAYRSVAARCNFLAIDRPDIAYATKEICQSMSRPKYNDWEKIFRLAGFSEI